MAPPFLPLVFAAVKAIIASFPSVAALREIQQPLAAEDMISTSHA